MKLFNPITVKMDDEGISHEVIAPQYPMALRCRVMLDRALAKGRTPIRWRIRRSTARQLVEEIRPLLQGEAREVATVADLTQLFELPVELVGNVPVTGLPKIRTSMPDGVELRCANQPPSPPPAPWITWLPHGMAPYFLEQVGGCSAMVRPTQWENYVAESVLLSHETVPVLARRWGLTELTVTDALIRWTCRVHELRRRQSRRWLKAKGLEGKHG
jgi:hypothetical protein